MTDFTTLPIPAIKGSALPPATLPLAGSEVVTVVQEGVTRRVAVANLAGGGITLSGSPDIDLTGTVNGITATFKAWNLSPTASTIYFSASGTANAVAQSKVIAGIPLEINPALGIIYLKNWDLGSGQTALLIFANDGTAPGTSQIIFQLNGTAGIHNFNQGLTYGGMIAITP